MSKLCCELDAIVLLRTVDSLSTMMVVVVYDIMEADLTVVLLYRHSVEHDTIESFIYPVFLFAYLRVLAP
jgi:hypothetical protein